MGKSRTGEDKGDHGTEQCRHNPINLSVRQSHPIKLAKTEQTEKRDEADEQEMTPLQNKENQQRQGNCSGDDSFNCQLLLLT